MKLYKTVDQYSSDRISFYQYDSLNEQYIFRDMYLSDSYIYEILEDGGSRQVCEYLSQAGDTLIASEENFLDTIKRELKKWAREERKLKIN